MSRLDLEPLTLLLALGVSAMAAPDEAPVAAPVPEPPPAVRTFLRSWAEDMKDVRSLRVEFEQTKQLRILRRPLETTGRTLLKGRRVLMVVNAKDGRPETEVLVTPGEVQIHYPRQKRLERLPLTEGAAPPTPFPLFGADLEELPRTYELSLEEDGEVLVLVPRGESPLRETRMRFEGTTIREVTQVTRRGDTVTLKVTKFELNPPIEDEELELEIPEGTEVVELGKPRERMVRGPPQDED